MHDQDLTQTVLAYLNSKPMHPAAIGYEDSIQGRDELTGTSLITVADAVTIALLVTDLYLLPGPSGGRSL